MKKSEIIEKYRAKITEAMKSEYSDVLNSRGVYQCQIYIWDDGEIERLPGPNGDNSWLQPNDCEERELFYVTTVKEPNFDPWMVTDERIPEDDAERETKEKELIDYVFESYDPDAILDQVIEQAKYDDALMEVFP